MNFGGVFCGHGVGGHGVGGHLLPRFRGRRWNDTASIGALFYGEPNSQSNAVQRSGAPFRHLSIWVRDEIAGSALLRLLIRPTSSTFRVAAEPVSTMRSPTRGSGDTSGE